MVAVATRGTAEDGLRATRLGVDAAACAARLARVRGGHLDERASRPQKFVPQHLGKAGPSRVRDAASAATSNHSSDVQFLQHNDAVALGESCRLDVQEVLALSPHLSVDAGHAKLGLLSVLGTFLPSTDGALCVSESRERSFEVARVRDPFAVGGRAEVGDASVDRDDGAFAQSGLGEVQLADDRDEPLVAISLEGARLRLPFEGPVDHGSEVPQLGETNVRPIDTPGLRVGLAEAKRVSPLPLPPRRTCKFGEASLPRPIQLHQELRAHVARDVGQPWQSGAELGQFVDLVEGRGVDAFAFRPGVPELPLLEPQVPEEAEGAFPRVDTSNLLGRRVDAVTEGLARQHACSVAQPTQTGLPPRPKGRGFRPEEQ